jgi:hypothetical protein
LRNFVLAGVEAAWLDDGERAAMRSSFTAELDALEAELDGDRPGTAPGPGIAPSPAPSPPRAAVAPPE